MEKDGVIAIIGSEEITAEVKALEDGILRTLYEDEKQVTIGETITINERGIG